MADSRSAGQRSSAAKQSLTEVFGRLKDREVYMAITGRGDTANTVLVEGRPNYIFVRIPKQIVTGTLEEYSEAQAFSQGEYRHGVPVIVARSEDNPSRYEIIDTWPIGLGESLIEAAIPPVSLHHSAHELYSTVGGHDPVMLDTIQARNLQVTPTSPPSSSVIIGGGWYIWKDRAVHWFDEIEHDLASDVPSGTLPFEQVTYMSLWLEPDAGVIVENPITVATSAIPDISELVQWPEEDHIPLACVRLVAGNYQIGWSSTGNPNYIDMRPPQALMPGDMLPAGHPLDPGGGYHSGTLEAVHVSFNDPSGVFDSDNVQDILEDELGPERTRVRVSVDDTAPGFLEDKIAAGSNITLTTLSPAGNEQLQIASTGGGGNGGGGDVSGTTEDIYIRQEIYDETLLASGRFDVDLTDINGEDFSTGFDHLEAVLTGRGDVADISDRVYLFYNADTTLTNYRTAVNFGGTTEGGNVQDIPQIGNVPAASSPVDYFSLAEIFIPEYSNTTIEKITGSQNYQRRDATVQYHFAFAHHWENSDAITQITVQPDGYPTDEFVAGSRLQIFALREIQVVTAVSGGGSGTLDTVEDDFIEVLSRGQFLNFTKNLIANAEGGAGRVGVSGTLEVEEDDVFVEDAVTTNFEGDGAFIDLDVIDEGSRKVTISGTFDETALDSRYFRKDEFITVSAGAGDAFKPIVLDANGEIDSSMIADDYVLNTGDIMTGPLEIQVATATDEALTLQTTDNNTTKKLLEAKDRDGNNTAYIDAVGNIAIKNARGFRIGGVGDTFVGQLKNTSGRLALLTDGTRDLQFGSASFPNALFIEGTNSSVGVGTTSIATSPFGPLLDIVGNSLTRDNAAVIRFSASAADAANVGLYRAKGTEASPTTVANGDEIGRFIFPGYDGTDYISSARVGSIVDGAVSAGVVPQSIIFKTGSTATPTIRVTINSSGNVLINGFTAATVGLIVRGAAAQSANRVEVQNSTGALVGLAVLASNNPNPLLQIVDKRTLGAGLTDGYTGGLRLDPRYDAAFTVTRHNYIDLLDPTLTDSAAVTDAAVMRFNAAAGTHKAVDAGTTKTTPGGVDAWIKHNINGTIYYVPAYTSKTA